MAAQDTPDAAERRARALLDGATPGEWTHYHDEDAGHPCVDTSARSDHRSRWIVAEVRSESMGDAALIAAAPDLARDVLSLADALRAAEARAVAAEGAIALLSRTLGCESDDPAGIVQEALDYAAEQRERADDRDEALAERDAAEARLAALAGAVDAVRAAHATATEAGAQYRAAWDAVDATPTIPQSEAIAAALRVSYEAQETLDTALTTLLRGAPGGYVPVGVVRAYLRAAAAVGPAESHADALRDDAWPDGDDDERAALAVADEQAEAARDAATAARTALDAALLAATTTPEEGHG